MMRNCPLVAGFLAFGLFFTPAVAQQPLDGSWAYQGSLSSAGENITDSADFEFTLWDAQVGGNQIGTMVTVFDVWVSDGLFSLTLDFGVDSLNGDKRWLEISVRSPHDMSIPPDDPAPFTTLAPRQPLESTPYAVQTRGLHVDDLSNVGIGTTTPGSPLHVQKGSAGAVTPHFQSLATFEDSGDSYLNLLTPSGSERGILFGDELSVVDGGIIFNNFENLSGLQFRTGNNQTRMTIDAQGHVGIGTDSPGYPLDVNTFLSPRTISASNYLYGGIAINGYANQEGESIGVRGESHSSSGIGVDGVALAGAGTTSGVRGFNYSSAGRGVYGVATSTTGTTIGVLGQTLSSEGYAGYFIGGRNYFEGNVGIGHGNPDAKLYIVSQTTSENDNTAVFSAPNLGLQSSHIHYGTKGDWYIRSAHESGKVILQDQGFGGVGIGTASPAPTTKLHVLGSTKLEGQLFATVITADYIDTTTLYVGSMPFGDHKNVQWKSNTGTFYYDNSSRRYKENITPLDDDFAALLGARAMTYTRPADPDRWEIGFIAEDFHDLGLTRLVDYDEEDRPDGINYEKICLYLTEIAKQQRSSIQNAGLQIAAMESSLASLQAGVDLLHSKENTEIQSLHQENNDLRDRLEALETVLLNLAGPEK